MTLALPIVSFIAFCAIIAWARASAQLSLERARSRGWRIASVESDKARVQLARDVTILATDMRQILTSAQPVIIVPRELPQITFNNPQTEN